MLSTKSRLLTRLPGTKKRTSMLFCGVKPGTSGQTTGRSSSETKHSAGCAWVAVNGRRINERGGFNARLSILPKTGFRHADLVVGNGQAAFGHVKNALGRAAVAARIVQHTLFDPVGIDDLRSKLVAVHRQ